MNSTERKQQPPTGVRLPEDLRVWLREKAEVNNRSLNQEIVFRLRRSREQEQADANAAS